MSAVYFRILSFAGDHDVVIHLLAMTIQLSDEYEVVHQQHWRQTGRGLSE
jgi:hypothetical protein